VVRSLKSLSIVFALLLCLISQLAVPVSSRAVADDASLVSTSTPEGRLVVFDDVWETIQDRYYDPRFRGIDWQAKRIAFRPAAAKAASTHEFYELMRHMIASLRDAHTRVYSPDEKFDWWNPRYVTIGVSVRDVEGVPVVVQVDQNSA
jgi:C-terminal processing protease CtpA/Prc